MGTRNRRISKLELGQSDLKFSVDAPSSASAGRKPWSWNLSKKHLLKPWKCIHWILLEVCQRLALSVLFRDAFFSGLFFVFTPSSSTSPLAPLFIMNWEAVVYLFLRLKNFVQALLSIDNSAVTVVSSKFKSPENRRRFRTPTSRFFLSRFF